MSSTRDQRESAAADVSVVIVSYNTRDLLRDALRSVVASQHVNVELFVVDNGSADGSAEMVEREFPAVQLIRNSENRGFAAANNVAIRRSSGRYVLLLNPDTVVQPTSISTLAGFLDAHPRAGICGPRVLNSDGSLQSCGYPFPTLFDEVRQSKNVNRVLRAVVGPNPTPLAPTHPTEVDWVDGCCLMIRRQVIREIGLLDEQYFLYAEELDWCFGAGRAGWSVVACPLTSITHHQGQSSSQIKEWSLAIFIETRLRFYRKNRGLMVALAASVVYALGFLKQIRKEPIKSRAKLRGISQWYRSLTAGNGTIRPTARGSAPA